MTRRDYILIADALNQMRRPVSFAVGDLAQTNQEKERNGYIDILTGIDKVVESLAAALSRNNPKFDSEHFLAVVRGEKDLNSRPTQKFNPSRRPYNPIWDGKQSGGGTFERSE